METESSWKGKLVVLFLIWPYVPIIFITYFDSNEASTLEWIVGGIIVFASIFWAYFIVQYLKKIFS